jgi:hypothetical protein
MQNFLEAANYVGPAGSDGPVALGACQASADVTVGYQAGACHHTGVQGGGGE